MVLDIPEINLSFTREGTLLSEEWQNTTWQDTKDILKSQGMAMLTPFQFRAVLRYLRDSQEYQELYKDIIEVRDPWKAERLNAKFEKREDGMYMISEDALINNKYENQILKLDDCLMQDRSISLDEWLDSTTPHGLPPANISTGDLFYWSPINKHVAGFDANAASRVYLCCDGSPGNLNESSFRRW